MMPETIYAYIKAEEARFQTDQIPIGDNWPWNFRNHVQTIFHLKHGVFFTGLNNWLRAFKNIMFSMIRLSNWTEDIEVREVVFYIKGKGGRVLSFLLKKYHEEVYTKENNLDEMFDEGTDSDNTYGGILMQKTDKVKPETIKLTTVAFCNQADILGSPIAFKHDFSPDKLRTMSKLGWGDEKNGATISIEDLILLATFDREPAGANYKTKTPGKNIEVYIVRGNLPDSYMRDGGDETDFYNQLHIVGYYTDKEGKQEGVTLYRKKDEESNLKFFTSEPIDGRALGFGVGEQELHPQIWTNFLEIHKMKMLEAGAKSPLWTDDESFKDVNKIKDQENLEVNKLSENRRIGLIQTINPVNVQLYERSINEWYQHAQLEASAFDPILGEQSASGTTFRGQERVVQQGKGAHNQKKGKRAKFFEEVYRDWIIDDMVRGILNGKKFLANLSSKEMQWVREQLAENYADRFQANMVLDGNLPPNGMTFKDHKETLKLEFSEKFSKKGNQRLLEILKDEFRDIKVDIGINIANKQKNLADLSYKVLSIFQSAFQNPVAFQQTMQIPGMSDLFNNILEFSGLDEVDFSEMTSGMVKMQQMAQQATPMEQPMQMMQTQNE